MLTSTYITLTEHATYTIFTDTTSSLGVFTSRAKYRHQKTKQQSKFYPLHHLEPLPMTFELTHSFQGINTRHGSQWPPPR